VPGCSGRQRPRLSQNGGGLAAKYSAAAGKITQTAPVSSRVVAHRGPDSPIRLMVRSVLCVVQGYETRSHSDLTDRDRDESSRRERSVWVRTNPQTQVR
jgi:hypothetical protein